MPVQPPTLPVSGPNLKLAALFGIAGALATLALMPYAMALTPQKFTALPLPLPAIVLAAAAQTGVLCWLLGWLGLYLGAPYGLDAPWLRAWVHRRPRDPARRPRWWLAVLLGGLAGLLVVGLSALGPKHAENIIQAWRGALVSFYGGIVEEVLCRLLLVSALVWLLARCNRRVARPWMFVLAIVLAALLFGAGHLPAAHAAGLLGTPLLVARIVLLNAVVAVVFGGLFWKYGLEHAMLAHFCADLVLHVALPLAGGF
ncbi:MULTISPECIES: CPBP family glutamic-type intramembrane protease [Rhodanobacter]|uniref:CPBP family glutamic-type intramembrane protease n=1 Tax=Rhodanobacter TaxID=75309 RepID=UPI000410DE03|nr:MULTISPECIES: CPBP family glutamic-type intramembrane protease [Rhodanobacter]KZC19543.1 abortive infection protein [Rhodanobacter denitrificans]UJJ49986.1 CPBP family glutamic-type intramembrane protease [Rhodanobacter denitrificans]UJM92700.1 CPBP family glutamic-type intramembrane protease [Rhodanobacter denitrificans]UJM96230.1 CPBP family glutamic-type intramembrane protease [Rhodanobacter denitrificans]UJN20939.1 CPBP family glutamic-type intramembrane protease [Rhodanobacter denitrif